METKHLQRRAMSRIKAGDIHLDYETRGNGPPLMMINGFRRSRVVWLEPFLEPMSAHFQLILFDNRGTGHSDKPEEGYSMDAFADDCAALLEALDIDRAHVFGTSMGGMIAQRLAVSHPSRVRGLAIGCSRCGQSEGVSPEKRIWELLRMMPGDEMDARKVAYLQEEAYVTDDFRAANRELLDRLFDVVDEDPPPPHAVKGHLKAIEDWEGCAALSSIAAPTLVITGAEDRLIPAENSRLMAKKIRGAKLTLLADAAHFFWIEKPEETAEALRRFFQGLS